MADSSNPLAKRNAELRQDLTDSEKELKTYRRNVREALTEAHSPLKLGAENGLGGLVGWAMYKLDGAVVNALTRKPGEPEKPLFGRQDPSLLRGLSTMGLGATSYAINLAFEYDQPITLGRGTVREIGATSFWLGFNEMVDALADILEQRKQRAQLEAAAQQRALESAQQAAQQAAQQPKK